MNVILVVYSLPPGNCFIFQIKQSRSGLYFTFPKFVWLNGEVTSFGTGITIFTELAMDSFLNWDLAAIIYSYLLLPNFLTLASMCMIGLNLKKCEFAGY